MQFRDQQPMFYSVRDAVTGYDQGLRSYMLGVYNYMGSALALTGLTAYLAAYWAPLTNLLYQIHDGHMGLTLLGWVTIFAPLALILFFFSGSARFGSARILTMSLKSAQTLFWVYAALVGLSLSGLCFAYTGRSIASAFLSTAILFGSMSIWGYSTKRDLTGMGHFMFMGVVGIIIASVVNMFLQSSGLQFAISVIGIIAFTGLTAYDTQKIKGIYYQVAGNAEIAGKTAIMGALNLYLDFINMFMMLLQLFGDRR